LAQNEPVDLRLGLILKPLCRVQTPLLKPSKALLTEIVLAHGGSMETKRPENDGQTFVLSDPEDRASWKPYLDKGIPI
jgi:hypothetical protein